uniref:hypothetical protein n=1 Tax=uncultured Corynebacterium sp. TaxID=159447 RepID=UPI0025F25DDB|nr:hypothetical protein [uncultured Corynebacterium sp.]
MTTPDTAQADSNQQEENTSTPPWGSDDDFNPEKAWSLIQNLRSEKTELQNKMTTLNNEHSATLSTLSERDTSIEELKASLELSEEAAKQAEAEHQQLAALRTKEHLLANAGIPASYAGNVTGETEDDWAESVAQLAQLNANANQAPTPTPKPDPAQAANEPVVDENAELASFIFGE